MDRFDELIGKEVRGNDDEKIGTINALYLADDTAQPSFASVRTSFFGGSNLVPISGIDMHDDIIRVPFDSDEVKDAPSINDDEDISPDDAHELYRHYGMEEPGTTGKTGQPDTGHGTDDAMTRSEEELHVGTRSEETGRYRLHKYIVTENVTKTVPVQREEVRLEREPITDSNRSAAMAGPDLSEGDHEIVTHADVPVVEKKVVPKERIKLIKDTLDEEETVEDEVRQERIDFDEDISNQH